MSGPRVLAVGYLSIDRISGPEGAHERVPGGAALYAALGARMAGAEAAISAAIGDDYPEPWLQALGSLGIDLSQVTRRGGPTRTASLAHASSGLRVSGHHGEPEWWERTQALSPALAGARDVDVVVAGPMPAAALSDIVRVAQKVGVPVVADTSEAFAARSGEAIRALLPDLLAFAPSREETRLLRPGLSDDEAAQCLAAGGPQIVQKRGADGAFAVGRGDIALIPAPPARVVDPTGAGDATVGALAAYLAVGQPLREAVTGALRVGAATVSGLGAAALGFRPEVETGLRRAGGRT